MSIESIRPRMLLFSCRATNHNLASSSFYEFEDLILDWMAADLIAPVDLRFNIRRKAQTFCYRRTRSPALCQWLASPKLGSLKLDNYYDVIFAILPNSSTTYKLSDFKNLREQCGTLVCYIPEVWAKVLKERPYEVEPLQYCDHIFVSTLHAVDTVKKMTGKPCQFLPLAVDAKKFSPFPHFPTRHIDVLNVGRASEATHRALVNAQAKSNFYYVYDTVASTKCINPSEHRLYYANTAKRSKFFIANMALFDQPWKTDGVVEVGQRFYEGAAAGAVLVGCGPVNHQVIRNDFDWPDAVISADADMPEIVDMLQTLESDASRIEEIRRKNVLNSLLRHDFVYRWARVLETIGVDLTPKMLARMDELRTIAKRVKTFPLSSWPAR